MASTYESIRSPMGSARIDVSNSSSNNTDTQTCLTSIAITEKTYNPSGEHSGFVGGINNVRLFYNTEIPTEDSDTCRDEQGYTPRKRDKKKNTENGNGAGIIILVVIIVLCCCFGVTFGIWFSCYRKT
jgi:hypothetical protein